MLLQFMKIMDIINRFPKKNFVTDLNASKTYEETHIELPHKFTYSVVQHKFADSNIKHE